LGNAGRAPSLTSCTLAFALHLRKKNGETSFRVAAQVFGYQVTMLMEKYRRQPNSSILEAISRLTGPEILLFFTTPEVDMIYIKLQFG
jgi:hypothetical protein